MICRALLLFALLISGCLKQSGYGVTMMHSETKSRELSGQWFTREIHGEVTYDEGGYKHTARGLVAVELVYCPIVTGEPTPPTCRTALVYDARKNQYLEPFMDKKTTNPGEW